LFLRFENFYRQFIKGYLEITAPLTRFTRKDTTFSIRPAEKNTIQALKDRFTSELVIRSFDEDKPSRVETDTSDTAVGAIHLQLDESGK
jgi:hypothetical protein